MKPVDQVVLHDPTNNQFGDCFRACVASLLEVPAEHVPHFLHDGNEAQFNHRVSAFLASRGLFALTIPARGWNLAELLGTMGVGDVYHVISGVSPRFPGQKHAVVGINGQFAHDPHPDRSWVEGLPEEWELTFLVAKNDGAGFAHGSCDHCEEPTL